MSTKRRRLLKVALLLLALLALGAFTFWRWNETTVVIEAAGPDFYDFGQVQRGSILEFSAKFLTSPNRRPLDAVWDWVIKRAPSNWQPRLRNLHPKKRRRIEGLAPTELQALKPALSLPPFVQVSEIIPDQRKEWYDGQPFFVVNFRLDTSRVGAYSGAATLRWKERQATLPIRARIHDAKQSTGRILIVSSPYDAFATGHGSEFATTTELLSDLPARVDLLRGLPSQLDDYDTILLADDGTADLSAQQRGWLDAFVQKGGRLILTCNAFYGRTVAHANEVLADHGLQVVNRDYGKLITVTNFAADPMTRDLAQLTFWRPSEIQLTKNSQAKFLALTDDGKGGFVAVTQADQGEIFVLGTSLWWAWLSRDTNHVGNVPLLRRLLTRD